MVAFDLYLFDLDGTLVDSVPDLAAAVDATLHHYQLPPAGVAAVRDWVGNGSRVLIERALRASLWCGAPPLSDTVIEAAHQRFLQCYQQSFCQHTLVFDGVVDTLKQLRDGGAKMAVVSNKPQQFIPPLLEHLNIASYFDMVVGGDSLPQKKPAPEPLLFCCQQMRIAPVHTLMVGDSQHDIAAAKAAKIKVAAVDYGYNHGVPIATFSPDFVLSHFSQVVGVNA
jgi:phosphoglycolate phosphatase